MRRTVKPTGLALILGLLCATPAAASEFGGSVDLGHISLDEDAGDLAAVQETYNIHEGFAVSRIRLDGRLDGGGAFDLDLREINLDSRQGRLSFRRAGLLSLKARFDQHRQLFSSDGRVDSQRKDWFFGGRLHPTSWLRLSADHGLQRRDGDRLSYPSGTEDHLGTGYDNELRTGRVEADLHRDGRGLAVGYSYSEFSDTLDDDAERRGRIFFVRAYGSDPFLPSRLSHMLRASFGRQELSARDLDYTLNSLQYVGTLRPHAHVDLRYTLYAGRIDDASTGLKTDDIRNDVDLTYRQSGWRLFGGYGYTTHDDDRTLTSRHAWRVGAAFDHDRKLTGRISYAGRNRSDVENLTLLKDIEDSRLRVDVKARPSETVSFGAAFSDRRREFPLIDVSADGRIVSAFAHVDLPGRGSIDADASHADDRYEDALAPFETECRTAGCRLNLDPTPSLRLSAGLTYLDISGDLDIEKSIVSIEGRYRLRAGYSLSVKYNTYSYDDFVLLDRYYTADVVWVNFGYDF